MGPLVRFALTFRCLDETLVGTLDAADGATGLLIVTGGRQTRTGPHRMMAMLAAALASEGWPIFRFDRRGVGDSSGTDPGFRQSAPDIAAAAAAFRSACPQIRQLWGLGLCDGASALALHHASAGLDGLILLNPWVIEAEAGSPPAAAIRAHYAKRLTTLEGWQKLLTRGFDPVAAVKGVLRLMKTPDQTLAGDVMASLAMLRGPTYILLSERDATAQAFLSVYRKSLPHSVETLDSASHTFAGATDQAWLKIRILNALRTG